LPQRRPGNRPRVKVESRPIVALMRTGMPPEDHYDGVLVDSGGLDGGWGGEENVVDHRGLEVVRGGEQCILDQAKRRDGRRAGRRGLRFPQPYIESLPTQTGFDLGRRCQQ